ncbi:hypothetical protein M404DRAFT_163995 [Pisolithus tinctorius Marx 270]|uniref:Chromo domain-containing protein n=1 Tax=Pisolithus tinctorius Marx 270 TaxID=870435 RepID=A0A0C3JEU7_PISTI|nr:hypothetical protein M404DRAFT_163995 [Pisolithus tinctorius Marx 270]
MRIHPVVNVSWVKPYLGALDGQPVNKLGPQRVTDEGDVKYEVEYAVNSHLKHGALQFLMHWRGYPKEDHMAPCKLSLLSSESFDSLFTPMPEPFTTVCPIWSCLEVKP